MAAYGVSHAPSSLASPSPSVVSPYHSCLPTLCKPARDKSHRPCLLEDRRWVHSHINTHTEKDRILGHLNSMTATTNRTGNTFNSINPHLFPALFWSHPRSITSQTQDWCQTSSDEISWAPKGSPRPSVSAQHS